jgi:hypothetical protein
MSFPFAEEAVEIDAIAQIDRISRRICSFGETCSRGSGSRLHELGRLLMASVVKDTAALLINA